MRAAAKAETAAATAAAAAEEARQQAEAALVAAASAQRKAAAAACSSELQHEAGVAASGATAAPQWDAAAVRAAVLRSVATPLGTGAAPEPSDAQLEALQERLGYRFAQPALLRAAFRHSSAAPTSSNGMLACERDARLPARRGRPLGDCLGRLCPGPSARRS